MGLVPLDAARTRVLEGCQRLPPAAVPLSEALGLVTSEPVVADQAVPPFANTAMDGFAVRAADTAGAPVRLRVVGTITAGSPPGSPVGPGQAVRIMTGAPIPPGADAVVMVERTEVHEEAGVVVVHQAVPPGEHVRPAGEDLSPGQEAFPAFTELSPGHVGVLASLGLATVPVFRRARVGVLSTGDELVDGPGPLGTGQIRDSNRPTLLALLGQSGCEAVDLGMARDSEEEITAAFERGLARCDALVTSGGVSVGDFDFVKLALDKLSGGSMAWMQVAVKPAKPLAFGLVDGTPVFGLPGNPVSSMVSFELFARPGLRHMMGHPTIDRLHVDAVADAGLPRRPDGKLHLVRVRADPGEDGRFHVRPSGGQASNLLRAMALANALALNPDGPGVEPGGVVRTMLLSCP
ncbi:MAG: molybdopterin molybdotransferase MoeA [Actinomycetota bacterium]|nr:molybdopterin molybdotransferase MoeA [Actinomycetota bacterium]